MNLRSFIFSLLIIGAITNFTICFEKDKPNLPICHGCSESVEPWLTKENEEEKSHFSCTHTNHMHERCIQQWMLEKPEKSCPECRVSGKLKVEVTIPEKDRIPGAQLIHEMDEKLEKTSSPTEGFIPFEFCCFIRNSETKGTTLYFQENTPKDLLIILRLATIAQKNTILVKELYLKQQKNVSQNSFTAFLKYLSDHPGKHGNLITYLQQCKENFELVSKFMPHIVNYWNKNNLIHPPTVDYCKLSKSLPVDWDLLKKYVALQEKFTNLETLTILNHPTGGTITLGNGEEMATNNPLSKLIQTKEKLEFKKILKKIWQEENEEENEEEVDCTIS